MTTISGEALIGLINHVLGAEREALAYAESLDNVREALGLEQTHYLVIHDDVKALKESYDHLLKACDIFEKNSEGAAELWEALVEIRDRPAPRMINLFGHEGSCAWKTLFNIVQRDARGALDNRKNPTT